MAVQLAPCKLSVDHGRVTSQFYTFIPFIIIIIYFLRNQVFVNNISNLNSKIIWSKSLSKDRPLGVKPVIQPIRAKNIYKSSPF